MKKIDTFIFVPAFHVGALLFDVLSRVPPEIWDRASVVVIDDGSTDDTTKEALRFKQTLPPEWRARYSSNSFPKNKGYGAVVKEGFSLALKSDALFICCLHGDGQYPPEQLPYFVQTMEAEGLDVLQGSRHLEKGGAKRGGMPFYKRVGGGVLTFIENRVFHTALTDRHSGFLCFSRRFVSAVPWSNLSGSFDIDLELLAVADAKHFKVAERPIKTRYAGESSNLNVCSYGLRVLRIVYRKATGFYTSF